MGTVSVERSVGGYSTSAAPDVTLEVRRQMAVGIVQHPLHGEYSSSIYPELQTSVIYKTDRFPVSTGLEGIGTRIRELATLRLHPPRVHDPTMLPFFLYFPSCGPFSLKRDEDHLSQSVRGCLACRSFVEKMRYLSGRPLPNCFDKRWRLHTEGGEPRLPVSNRFQ